MRGTGRPATSRPTPSPTWRAVSSVPRRRWQRLGGHGQLVAWDPEQVQAVCASPAFRDGQWMPSAASIQPARLARGLRRVLLERGVIIHENTRVLRLSPDSGSGGPGQPSMGVITDQGSVLAHQAVLAVNAWAAGWPGHRLRLLAWGSYMVVTEPIPDRLAELGWTGGELLSDTRFTISYFRTTRDGRIAFGAGVGAAGFDGRIGRTFTADQRAVAAGGGQLRPPVPHAPRRPVRGCLGWTNRHQCRPLPGDRVTARRSGALRPRLRRQRGRAGAAGGPHPGRAGGRSQRPVGSPPARRPPAAAPPAGAVPVRRGSAHPRGAHPARRRARRRGDARDDRSCSGPSFRACWATASSTDHAAPFR